MWLLTRVVVSLSGFQKCSETFDSTHLAWTTFCVVPAYVSTALQGLLICSVHLSRSIPRPRSKRKIQSPSPELSGRTSAAFRSTWLGPNPGTVGIVRFFLSHLSCRESCWHPKAISTIKNNLNVINPLLRLEIPAKIYYYTTFNIKSRVWLSDRDKTRVRIPKRQKNFFPRDRTWSLL